MLKKQLADKKMELEILKKAISIFSRRRRGIYALIERHRNEFPVEMMCRVMGVSRSGYYAWRNRPKSKRSIENQAHSQQIKEIFYESKQSYGSPRVTGVLKARGIDISRQRVARLMKKST